MTIGTAPLEVLAVGLCARSGEHTAGRGNHNAMRYGACSLHKQMADEVQPLVPTDLFTEVQWRVIIEDVPRATRSFGTDEARARAVRDEEEHGNLWFRVLVSSRAEGSLMESAWDLAHD